MNIFLNKKILIYGLGKSGLSSFTFLKKKSEVFLKKCTLKSKNYFALYAIDKLPLDACQTMLEIEMDLLIYESMMSRNANFRHRDLSSVLKNKQLTKYLKRFFLKGNEFVPDRIKKENPILHLCTHNLLGYSEPFFKSYPEKLKFLEIVRHPLYQVIQMSLNYHMVK